MRQCGDGHWEALNRIEQLIAKAPRPALLSCQLRHYDQIAALYGRAIAEELVDAGHQHLMGLCGSEAELVRLASDRLVLVLANASDAQSVEQLAHRCAATWSVQKASDQTPLLLTMAIGMALSQGQGDATPLELLHRADLAAQQALRRPGSQVVLATGALNRQLQATYEGAAALHLAVEQQHLTAFLQPIVNLVDGEPIGFECLARWPLSSGELISPAAFLEQASDTGITADIDLQVLSNALESAPQLAAAYGGTEPLLLSSNISAQLIENPRKVEELLQLLEQHLHTSPVKLQLELLEESLNQGDGQLDDLLNALARLGVLIAIDDFGTGYSSLSRVHNLAINTIKIDRSFVQRINDPTKPSDHLLQTLLAIGHDLQIDLTAEGIEQESQRRWLHEQGCSHGQGFLFSKPLSLNAAIDYLTTN